MAKVKINKDLVKTPINSRLRSIKARKKSIRLISVIVPAYRQEKTIQKDLRRIKLVLDKLRYKSELICVVDGIIDKTFEKAKKITKKYRGIKVVGYDVNRGKGYAVRFGMAKSKGDLS